MCLGNTLQLLPRIKMLLPHLKVFICVFVCVIMMEIVKFQSICTLSSLFLNFLSIYFYFHYQISFHTIFDEIMFLEGRYIFYQFSSRHCH